MPQPFARRLPVTACAALAACAFLSMPAPAQTAAAEPASEVAEEPDPLAPLRAELDRLETERRLREERLQAELAEIQAEKQRLEARAELDKLKGEGEVADLKRQAEQLEAAAALREAQFHEELAAQKMAMERERFERQKRQADLETELSEMREQAERLRIANEIESAKSAALESEMATAGAEQRLAVARYEAALGARAARDEYDARVIEPMDYSVPAWDGTTLTISDRRIALNDVIIDGTASYVADRIDFYNNVSTEHPIFIVIDDCPGGSVMEGYRILEAMHSSRAPVYVVVKSFAASMAAVIATLAEQSFALPNAIVLHHQMSGVAFGNLTEQTEQIEVFKEWERRLHQPVADKMGVSLEEFRAMMYEHSIMGDWEEFADNAAELKWVDHVVGELHENGLRDKPTGEAPKPWFWFLLNQDKLSYDADGKPYFRLPPLRPFDMYWMYDPMERYR